MSLVVRETRDDPDGRCIVCLDRTRENFDAMCGAIGWVIEWAMRQATVPELDNDKVRDMAAREIVRAIMGGTPDA